MADRLIDACWMAGAVGAGVAATHLALQGTTDWRVWLPCAAVLLSGLWLWHARRQVITGELTFDGESWWLSSSTGVVVVAAGRACVCLDLQRLVLLRIEAVDRPGHWLWVDREADRPRWRDLRRVLYAGARGVAGDALPQDGRAVSA